MERALGIGGLFFRSADPGRLAAWYADCFGIGGNADGLPWQQEAGMTVFQPFAADSDYFGNPQKVWMLNLRVADLAAMVAQLQERGVTVGPVESYPYGDFARLTDPEGNPIELWQPRDPAAAG
jgi:predicted enzyme related to lactoylglutathione lyase